MKIEWIEVGAQKKSWSEELPNIQETTLYRAVKRGNALGSRCIDFYWDNEKQEGMIVVGNVRPAGRFKFPGVHVEATEIGFTVTEVMTA